jgi:hypothetical protein
MKAVRGGAEVCLHSFFKTRDRWEVNAIPRPLYTREWGPVTAVQQPVWTLGPVWTDAEKSSHHLDSIPGPTGP